MSGESCLLWEKEFKQEVTGNQKYGLGKAAYRYSPHVQVPTYLDSNKNLPSGYDHNGERFSAVIL